MCPVAVMWSSVEITVTVTKLGAGTACILTVAALRKVLEKYEESI